MDARYRPHDERNRQREIAELKIEDELVPLSGRYSLRFVERAGRPAKPVLYYDGRRVIRAWSLRFEHSELA